MDKNNLIDFYVVGKTIREKDFRMVHLESIERGWVQRAYGRDRTYDFVYVSNETVPELIDWFKKDFTQYRMFDAKAEASAYLADKLSCSIR